MIKVLISEKFELEKKYILDVILGDFLGVPFRVEVGNYDGYVLCVGEKRILVKDYFFSNVSEETYLDIKFFPKEIKTYKYHEEDLIVIYGKGEVREEIDEIVSELDIFSSSYFMLTRWEEHVSQARDRHGRFDEDTSFSVRASFFHRPVVNEYLDFLKLLLRQVGYSEPFKSHKFSVFHSHDVDDVLLWKNPLQFAKYFIKYAFLYPSLSFTLKSFFQYPLSVFFPTLDPYYTFDYLMSLSGALNVPSYFFFMSGGTSVEDNRYKLTSPLVLNLMQHICDSGHKIGFHPSYNSFNNVGMFKKEYTLLNEVSPQPLLFGRQHYLRFEAPLTWQIWDDFGFKESSTLGFSSRVGFRTGTCYKYPVFNFITRKRLNLKESPLHIMDVACHSPNLCATLMMFDRNRDLIKKVKYFEGSLGLLWHNSNINLPDWQLFKLGYEAMLNEITSLK